MIASGYDDAVPAFTSVAARKFASPSCQQVKALSSRFSGPGCPEPEGTRLSGERVITRADSFHSASTSTSLWTHPLISPALNGLIHPFNAGDIKGCVQSDVDVLAE